MTLKKSYRAGLAVLALAMLAATSARVSASSPWVADSRCSAWNAASHCWAASSARTRPMAIGF